MRSLPSQSRRLVFASIISATALLLFPAQPSLQTARAAHPQGKGGTIKPIPTPTPVPKKNAPTTRANRTGTSKPARQAAPTAAKPSAAEIAFWESIKDSKNPEEFRAYLKKYPNGEFADLARSRLNALDPAAKEGAKKAARRPGAVVKNSMGMEFGYVPAGSFMMGSSEAEAQAAYSEDKRYSGSAATLAWVARETPQHQVTIREGFYMGRYEVTQAEWQQVMGNNPTDFKGCDNCPVEGMSWDDAQEFIRRLNSGGDEYTYRLPTEAEWEYACRAGTTTPFAFGTSLSSEQANFNGDYPYGDAAKGIKRGKTIPVGSFRPNAWGLYDMHGNVSELCEDWYHDSYNGAPTDGSAWLSGGEEKYRVYRGGAYDGIALWDRSAYRGYNFPGSRSVGIGFRVVAVVRAQ